jgi:hypothetical protein
MNRLPKGTGHGGKRAGSGRKSKAFLTGKVDVNAAIQAQLLPVLAELIEAMINAAGGIKMIRLGPDGQPLLLPDGTPEAYLVAPDKDAIICLINRAAGKPIDRPTPPPEADTDDYVIDLSADDGPPAA